jgi:hypothetical protein
MSEPQKQCFNCGKDLEKRVTFCPHCNAPLPLHGAFVGPAIRFFLLAILGTFSLILSGLGGCFLLATFMIGATGHNAEWLAILLVTITFIGGAGLCAWGLAFISGWKKTHHD